MVSNIFYFHPNLGKIPNVTNIIFQMGWNHQLVVVSCVLSHVSYFFNNFNVSWKYLYALDSLDAQIQILFDSKDVWTSKNNHLSTELLDVHRMLSVAYLIAILAVTLLTNQGYSPNLRSFPHFLSFCQSFPICPYALSPLRMVLEVRKAQVCLLETPLKTKISPEHWLL